MQQLLITGASGFLGKHLLLHLRERFEIHTISRYQNATFSADLANEVPVISGHYNLVIHAAGKAHAVPTSKSEADEFMAVNDTGTQHLCKAFDATGNYPEQFVFISTVAVYGLESGELISEQAPLLGSSPYAASKINAESFLQAWSQQHHVKLTILRLPLIAGTNPPGNLGTMIRAIKRNRYFNIGKGDARKSMVMADDIAKYIPEMAMAGGVFNLTDGQHPSFAELALLIATQTGKKQPMAIPYFLAAMAARIGDIFGEKSILNSAKLNKINATLTFDDSKARKAFGWQPGTVLGNLIIN